MLRFSHWIIFAMIPCLEVYGCRTGKFTARLSLEAFVAKEERKLG
jgi:hypothetical protein